MFGAAIVVIGSLQFMFYRTPLGRALRATSDDPEVARLMGYDNKHLFGIAMALSLAVAAVAGAFLAVRANFAPSDGPARLIFGFEFVIIGGLGSLWGTLIGGIILGVAQSLGAMIDPGWQLLAGHLAFLLVLAVRDAEGRGMSAAASVKITRATPESRIAAVLGSIVVVGLAAAPLWLDRNVISIAGQMLVYVGLASLWNLLAGYGGFVSVGQQAYVGMGAYLLFAGGILLGVRPSSPFPSLAGIFFITRSRWGLALQAIRDNEIAAESSGVDVAGAKRLLYAAAAAGAAMLGALIGLAKLRISPDALFSVNDWTAYVIFITVIGGIGRIEGPILGTIIFFALRETLSDLGPAYLIALGAVAVVTMLFAPKGVYGYFADRFHIQLFPIARRVKIDAPVTDGVKNG